MKYEVALTADVAQEAENHLLCSLRQGMLQEGLCFALWQPSTGQNRLTGIVSQILLPHSNECKEHGNVSFSAKYLARAIQQAHEKDTGIALMHSHPSRGWQDMSKVDIIAERDRVAPVSRATQLPLIGLTLGIDSVWSARFWKWNGSQFSRKDCDKVRVVGKSSINLSLNPKRRKSRIDSDRLRRTLDTWGAKQQNELASLRFGIVGLGSVGTLIAENLARIGATNVLLIDADRIEEHNLDRLLYASSRDVGRFKVDVVAENLKRSATAKSFDVKARRAWIQEKDAYLQAMDCDMLFIAVDRPLPKDVLNQMALAHCIPLIFGGVRVATKINGRLADATWSVLFVTPSSRCLRCDGQYTTSDVSMELDGSLHNPSYTNRNGNQDAQNENVFSFSANLASLMVLEMLRSVIREDWWPDGDTKLHYSYMTNQRRLSSDTCNNNCSVAERTCIGDKWQHPFIDRPICRYTRFERFKQAVTEQLQNWLEYKNRL